MSEQRFFFFRNLRHISQNQFENLFKKSMYHSRNGSHLSRIVPADVDPGVQLASGGAVKNQPLPLQGLDGSAAVQVHVHDLVHWGQRRKSSNAQISPLRLVSAS